MRQLLFIIENKSFYIDRQFTVLHGESCERLFFHPFSLYLTLSIFGVRVMY